MQNLAQLIETYGKPGKNPVILENLVKPGKPE